MQLLEHNVATKMAKEIDSVATSFNGTNWPNLERSMNDIATARPGFTISSKASEAMQKRRESIMAGRLSPNAIDVDFLGSQMKKICGLPKRDTERWAVVVGLPLSMYRRCLELAGRESFQSKAYETFIKILYENELELKRRESRPSEEAIKISAMQTAEEKIGMAPPRADTMFRIEAVWLSIDIRLLIGRFSESVFTSLLANEDASPAQLEAWANFTAFIYDSCSRDAASVLRSSNRVDAYRHEILSGLRIFTAGWEKMQFVVTVMQSNRNQLGAERRKLVVELAKTRLRLTKEASQRLRTRFIPNGLPLGTIREEFDVPMERCLSGWESLIQTMTGPNLFRRTFGWRASLEAPKLTSEHSQCL
jgi:hypothetical protein